MEKNKTSKKALGGLINDSMRDAIKTLELPKTTKKIDKLIARNSKKLAVMFSEMMKREEKKKRKAERFLESSVNGKVKKSNKTKGVKLTTAANS